MAQGIQQMRPGMCIEVRNPMKQINDRDTRRTASKHSLHLADIGILRAEIRYQDDHVRS
jgi:hypothetical protein